MSNRLSLAALLVVAALSACIDPAQGRSSTSSHFTLRPWIVSAVPDDPTSRQYGAPLKVGEGTARTYVSFDASDTRVPVEVGVALSETALGGLPSPMVMTGEAADAHQHLDMHVYDLTMPSISGTPYQFVELDWNPGGHEPAGVYDVPHFDFHFYTVDKTVRDGIDPVRLGEKAYLEKSGNLPAEAERAPNFRALSAPGTPVLAVPRMGTHWVDVRTPELQAMFGRPEAYLPFTTTFIHGSWDGQFIFDEPMITRAFIMARKTATTPAERDRVIDLPLAKSYAKNGYYPEAYRITWDEAAREYRIALTKLARR